MKKYNIIFIIGTITFNSLNCSRHSESKEHIQEKKTSQDIVEIQNQDEYKNLLDIIDSIASSIAYKQENDNSKVLSFQERSEDETDINPSQFHPLNEEANQEIYLNSVKGHLEQPSITGNFTGLGIDTLYVLKEIDLSFVKQENENPEHLSLAYLSKYTQFFVISNNPIIPKFEIYGYWLHPPKLVYEGDLDYDGKDEWGYLVTGENSQWRQYNVFNFDLKNKKWRYLYKDSYRDEFLNTRQSIRESGKEIVEKGKKKGEIKINYTDYHDILRDTLVQANYLPFE